jgi:enoyl-CoA hydratase/carnithine racemase
MTAVEKCRKPVIAAIHSHCIGGGVDLTSACDIRLATRDAVFSIRETKMAMIADVGTLQRLPTIIGQGRFRELALTGRNFSAAEAYEMGYLSRVCEDREELYREAKKIADEIAACSPVAVQGTKEVILFNRDHGIQAGLEYVAQKNAAILPNDDLLEAIAAFLEKRAPVFRQQ